MPEHTMVKQFSARLDAAEAQIAALTAELNKYRPGKSQVHVAKTTTPALTESVL